MALDLCQAQYQTLLTIYLKDFIIIGCKSCLDYMTTKNEQLIFSCFECKKNYKKNFNKELINRFSSTYNLCKEDTNKFILLLRKGFYPCEYMDTWERFDETSLSEKRSFL